MVEFASLAQNALKLFFQLVQQELAAQGLEKQQLQEYLQPASQFLRHQSVRRVLANALKQNSQELDSDLLNRIWRSLNLKALPPKFSWNRVSDLFLRRMKGLGRREHYRQRLWQRYHILEFKALERTTLKCRLPLRDLFVVPMVREALLVTHHGVVDPDLQAVQAQGDSDQTFPADNERYDLQVGFGQSEGSVSSFARSVLEVLQDKNCHYVAILGEPGSGKSSLLHYLMLKWVEDPTGPLPLLASLRAYKDCVAETDVRSDGVGVEVTEGQPQNFLEFLCQANPDLQGLNATALQRQLQAGQVRVLLDDLDRLTGAEVRQAAIAALICFVQDYPNVQILVTGQSVEYDLEPLQKAGFRHFMLQAWNAEQIEDFIQKWYALSVSDDVERERRQRQLRHAIHRAEEVVDLARLPLLLTALAICNSCWGLSGSRIGLYEQLSQVLLTDWQADDFRAELTGTIGQQQKVGILQRLAWEMQVREAPLENAIIRGRDLLALATQVLEEQGVTSSAESAVALLDQWCRRSSILCTFGDDCYRFIHRSFGHYFCARALVQSAVQSASGERSKTVEDSDIKVFESLKTKIFGQHWQEDAWQGVLTAIAGAIAPDEVGELIDFLLIQEGEPQQFRNLFLAARCLAEVSDRRAIQSPAARLYEQLAVLLQHGEINISLDERHDDSDDSRQALRIRAVQAIAATWVNDLSTLTWLQTCAQTYSHLQRTVMDAIVTYYQEDPETLRWLKTCAEINSGLRESAILAIAETYPDDPETLPWLKACAQANRDFRRIAVDVLAKYYNQQTDTLSWLQNYLQTDDDRLVRLRVVLALIQYYSPTPAILFLLQASVRADESADIRWSAMKAMLESFSDAPETFSSLQVCAQNDEDEGVRRQAIEAITHHYPDSPEAQSWLQSLPQTDRQDETEIGIAITDYDLSEISTPGWLSHDSANDLHIGLSTEQRLEPELEQNKGLDTDIEQQQELESAIEQQANESTTEVDADPQLESMARQSQQETINEEEDLTTLAWQLAQETDDDEDLATLAWQLTQKTDARDVETQENSEALEDELNELLATARSDTASPETFAALHVYAQKHESERARTQALMTIADCQRNDPETLIWLQTRAQEDRSVRVRMEAFQIIAQLYRDTPGILPWLQSCALSAGEAGTRQAAVAAIAKHFSTDAGTLTLLKLRAQFDEAGTVRGTAIAAIADQFSTDPDTLPLLEASAQSDVEETVRLAAINGIARHYPEAANTFSLLQSRAQSDEAGLVRSAAVSALADRWNFAIETFELLYSCILNDPFQRSESEQHNPRQAALESMLKHYRDDPLTLELMRDRAQNDPDEHLRIFAWEQLQDLE